mgnify:CR=1 FL=1
MPELPEVETVRRGLTPAMAGRRIAAVRINRRDLRWPLPETLETRLAGTRVLRLSRRGKYLLVALDSGETLLIHLGMSGRMVVHATGGGDAMPGRFHNARGAAGAHDHVILRLEDGAEVVFNDPRRFGSMDLWPTAAIGAHPRLAGLGPEPLDEGFDGGVLARALAGRRAPVRALLLDQRIVAGLGNIYVSESLHEAGIAPARAGGRIARARLERLAGAVRAVLGRAIAAGGATLRDHRRADGTLGYFQHDFRVYDRAGAPCPRPGCEGTIRRHIQGGRASYHCPRCQR